MIKSEILHCDLANFVILKRLQNANSLYWNLFLRSKNKDGHYLEYFFFNTMVFLF